MSPSDQQPALEDLLWSVESAPQARPGGPSGDHQASTTKTGRKRKADGEIKDLNNAVKCRKYRDDTKKIIQEEIDDLNTLEKENQDLVAEETKLKEKLQEMRKAFLDLIQEGKVRYVGSPEGSPTSGQSPHHGIDSPAKSEPHYIPQLDGEQTMMTGTTGSPALPPSEIISAPDAADEFIPDSSPPQHLPLSPHNTPQLAFYPPASACPPATVQLTPRYVQNTIQTTESEPEPWHGDSFLLDLFRLDSATTPM